jgi:hypothetical protein
MQPKCNGSLRLAGYLLAYSSTLEMEAVCFSETSKDLYQTTMPYDKKVVHFMYVRSSTELHGVIFMTILIFMDNVMLFSLVINCC